MRLGSDVMAEFFRRFEWKRSHLDYSLPAAAEIGDRLSRQTTAKIQVNMALFAKPPPSLPQDSRHGQTQMQTEPTRVSFRHCGGRGRGARWAARAYRPWRRCEADCGRWGIQVRGESRLAATARQVHLADHAQ